MPLPENIKPQLNKYVSASVGSAQAMVITRVQKEADRMLNELLTQCPPVEVLESMSNTLNTLRPILISADKKVQQAGNVGKFLEPTILAASIIIDIITSMPLPAVFMTPPGPVTVGATGPYGVLKSESIATQTKRNARVQFLQKTIETLTDEGRAIKQVVTGASGTLTPVKVKLDQIDALIQTCLVNQNLSDEERKRLLAKIKEKNQDPSNTSLEYTSTSGYTYTIKVIQDPNSPEIAPKRQAIVQDFRGITVLTGPSSFASNPQILIEEIKFRIENQLP